MSELNLGIEGELPVRRKPKTAPEKATKKKMVKKVEKKTRGRPKKDPADKLTVLATRVPPEIAEGMDKIGAGRQKSFHLARAAKIYLKIVSLLKDDVKSITVEVNGTKREVRL